MHNAIAHYLLPNARCPSPNSDQPLHHLTAPQSTVYVWNIPLVSLGHLFHLCFLSVSFEYLFTGRA